MVWWIEAARVLVMDLIDRVSKFLREFNASWIHVGATALESHLGKNS
jgi:hypothetical protein